MTPDALALAVFVLYPIAFGLALVVAIGLDHHVADKREADPAVTAVGLVTDLRRSSDVDFKSA